MNLSYGYIKTYKDCSEKYRYEKIEKIKPLVYSSALHFGACLDKALNAMLLTKKDTLTDEEKLLTNKTPWRIFEEEFQMFKDEDAVITSKLEYTYSDAQTHILEDLTEIKEYAKENDIQFDNIDNWIESLKKRKKQPNEQRVFNSIAWSCLMQKAKMFIKLYEEEVMPLIEKVYDVQEKINLTNELGDTIHGYIDFTCKFYGDDNIYVMDNKSSTGKYDSDSVNDSDQLKIYCESKRLTHAGYIVLDKNIRKNFPQVRWQLLKSKIPEEKFQDTFDEFITVLENIKDGQFHKKDDRKECWFYGKKCQFYNKCWS